LIFSSVCVAGIHGTELRFIVLLFYSVLLLQDVLLLSCGAFAFWFLDFVKLNRAWMKRHWTGILVAPRSLHNSIMD
jgi:hypothetical protein